MWSDPPLSASLYPPADKHEKQPACIQSVTGKLLFGGSLLPPARSLGCRGSSGITEKALTVDKATAKRPKGYLSFCLELGAPNLYKNQAVLALNHQSKPQTTGITGCGKQNAPARGFLSFWGWFPGGSLQEPLNIFELLVPSPVCAVDSVFPCGLTKSCRQGGLSHSSGSIHVDMFPQNGCVCVWRFKTPKRSPPNAHARIYAVPKWSYGGVGS